MSLKKTGLEIRSRPYSYLDTPQLDLDSLMVYTSGLKMSVSEGTREGGKEGGNEKRRKGGRESGRREVGR